MTIKRTVLSYVGLLVVATLLASCGHRGSTGSSWSFTFAEVDGNATLDMDGVAIVFEGEQISGSSSGGLRLSGGGNSKTKVGGGDRTLSIDYSNGVNFMRFRKYQFQVRDGGNTLSIRETDVDLSQGKKLVTVSTDGSVTFEDM